MDKLITNSKNQNYINNFEEEYIKLSRFCSELSKSNQELNISLQNRIKKCDNYEEKINNYEAKHNEYEGKINEYVAKNNEYKSKINEYEKKINEYEAKINAYETKINEYKAKHNNYDPRLLKTENNNYDQRLLKKENNYGQRLLKKENNNYEKLKIEYQCLESENSILKIKNKTLSFRNKSLESRNYALNTKIEIYFKDHQRTVEDNHRLKSNEYYNNLDIQDLKKKINDKDLELNKIYESVNEKNEMIDELKFKIKCMYDHPEDTFYITSQKKIFKKKNCNHGTNCFKINCKFRHIKMNKEQISEYDFFKNKYQHEFQNKSNNIYHNKKRPNDTNYYPENYKTNYYPENYKKNIINNNEYYYERNTKRMKY